jgi:hypothetical protein
MSCTRCKRNRTRGIKTSLDDISLTKARLKTAIELHAESEDEGNKEHKKQR